jgi:hypothetical protein
VYGEIFFSSLYSQSLCSLILSPLGRTKRKAKLLLSFRKGDRERTKKNTKTPPSSCIVGKVMNKFNDGKKKAERMTDTVTDRERIQTKEK